MSTTANDNSPATGLAGWLGSIRSRFYSGSRRYRTNTILIVLFGIAYCSWLGYTAYLPAIIFSTTQKSVDVSVEQIENGEMPYQFNWNLTGFRPVKESCIPSFWESGGELTEELRGYFLPVISDQHKLDDAAERPVVLLEANQDFIEQRKLTEGHASSEIIALASTGQVSGHRTMIPSPVSSFDLENLQKFYPGYSAEDFLVFTLSDSADTALLWRAGEMSLIVGMFFLIYVFTARYGWKKYLAEKLLESKLDNDDCGQDDDCQLAIQYINEQSTEVGSTLHEPFNPPSLEVKKKLQPIVFLTLFIVSIVAFLGFFLGAIFLARSVLELFAAYLAISLVYRSSRRFWGYLSRREPEEMKAWFPESKLPVGESNFYKYHKQVLERLGFKQIGEDKSCHFFACPNHRLLAVLGIERRKHTNYFSLFSVLQGGELVETTSLPKKIRARSLHQPDWFVTAAEELSLCQAIVKHREVIEEMQLDCQHEQFAITESNYTQVVQHIERLNETAWSSMIENTWFAV